MADHPRHPDPHDETGVGSGYESATGTPWGTYAFVLIAIVVILGMVVLHLTGVVGPGAH